MVEVKAVPIGRFVALLDLAWDRGRGRGRGLTRIAMMIALMIAMTTVGMGDMLENIPRSSHMAMLAPPLTETEVETETEMTTCTTTRTRRRSTPVSVNTVSSVSIAVRTEIEIETEEAAGSPEGRVQDLIDMKRTLSREDEDGEERGGLMSRRMRRRRRRRINMLKTLRHALVTEIENEKEKDEEEEEGMRVLLHLVAVIVVVASAPTHTDHETKTEIETETEVEVVAPRKVAQHRSESAMRMMQALMRMIWRMRMTMTKLRVAARVSTETAAEPGRGRGRGTKTAGDTARAEADAMSMKTRRSRTRKGMLRICLRSGNPLPAMVASVPLPDLVSFPSRMKRWMQIMTTVSNTVMIPVVEMERGRRSSVMTMTLVKAEAGGERDEGKAIVVPVSSVQQEEEGVVDEDTVLAAVATGRVELKTETEPRSSHLAKEEGLKRSPPLLVPPTDAERRRTGSTRSLASQCGKGFGCMALWCLSVMYIGYMRIYE